MRHRFYLLMAVCYCCLQTSIIANNATENFLHFTKDGFPLKVEPDAPLPPSLTCPGDMIFDLAPGECSIVVTFDVSAQAANPGDIVTITQTDGTGFISGDAFPIGTTVLSFDATDPTGTVSCTFSITVNEFSPPTNALTCTGNVNISLSSSCKAIITPNMILEGNYGCFDNFIVDVNGTGTNVVDIDLLGQTITISVTNVLTGNTCWGNGFVEDKLPPLITGCDSVFINCFQNPLPVSEGGDVPDPSISDCSSFDVFHVDEMIQGGCDSTFTMLIRRNWTATDASGRVSTCTQVITIQTVSLVGTTPVCPADVAVECAFGSLQSLAPSVTGYPTLLVGGTVYDIANNSNSVCTITSGFSDDTIPHCGASFRIIRTWTVIDWCQPLDFVNNPWTCLQLLDFNDNTPPGLSAPAHFTVGTDVGSCTATPVIPPAVVFDCSGLTVTILTPVGTINGNGGQVPSPGLNFGDNLITFKATDDCGNISTDTLTITVIDDVKPHPVCQSFTTVGLDGNGFAKAFAAAFDAGSNDNCCLDGFQVRRMSDNCGVPENTSFGDFVTFCCADLGTPVMVVFRAFDCWGNFNDCMVQVEVQDKIIPQFTCPPDITLECGQDHTDL